MRAISVAFSPARPSRLKNEPGILPAAYIRSSMSTVSGMKSMSRRLPAVAVPRTRVSPEATRTAPEACLASLPVSKWISAPPISTETRCTSDMYSFLGPPLGPWRARHSLIRFDSEHVEDSGVEYGPMPRTIVVFGATGYTGRLIAERLVAHGAQPLLAGRSEARLRELADAPRRARVRHAPTSTGRSPWRRSSSRATCSSPRVGPVPALGRAGGPRRDRRGARSTWTPRASRRSSGACSTSSARPRREAGATLMPAMGYDFVPGAVAGALALDAAGPRASRVDVGYFTLGGGPELDVARHARVAGGRGARATASPSAAASVRTVRSAERMRDFPVKGKERPASPSAVRSTSRCRPSYPQLQEVNVYLGWFGPLARGIQLDARGLRPPPRACRRSRRAADGRRRELAALGGAPEAGTTPTRCPGSPPRPTVRDRTSPWPRSRSRAPTATRSRPASSPGRPAARPARASASPAPPARSRRSASTRSAGLRRGGVGAGAMNDAHVEEPQRAVEPVRRASRCRRASRARPANRVSPTIRSRPRVPGQGGEPGQTGQPVRDGVDARRWPRARRHRRPHAGGARRRLRRHRHEPAVRAADRLRRRPRRGPGRPQATSTA